jgi:hypothetical protein
MKAGAALGDVPAGPHGELPQVDETTLSPVTVPALIVRVA